MSKLRELEKRLKEEPDNLGLRVMVAGALREAGRQGEAVELYRSVAAAYRDQGRAQQAIAVCRSILEVAPDDAPCQALLESLVAHDQRAAVPGDEIVIEAGTPTPPEPAAGRPLAVPRTAVSLPRPGRAPSVPFPARRPSFDETPLPRPVPHHVADPTARLRKLSDVDLPVAEGAKTRPGSEDGAVARVDGLASAARRISASLIGLPDRHADLAVELDTRPRRRIESRELEKIAPPPPTVPVARLEAGDVDEEAQTPAPHETVKLRARPAAEPSEDDEDDGIPTLSDDDHEEDTRPRDMSLETMLRAEAEGPLAGAFFAPLPVDRRGAVFMRFHRKSVASGTTVIRQGEVGHCLVVVERGQLELRLERANGLVLQLGAVAVGEFVGEAALLARTPAALQVIAAIDSELLLLPPRDFYEIAGAFPALWAELKDVAERRTRELELRLKR